MRIPRGIIEGLLQQGGDGPGLEERLEVMTQIRAQGGNVNLDLDRIILAKMEDQYKALEEAKENFGKLEKLLDKVCSEPLRTAMFLRMVETERGERPLVSSGGGQLVVAAAEGLDLSDIELGEEVLLTSQQNCMLERCYTRKRAGDTVTVNRILDDGRLVVTSRDEELIAECAPSLFGLKPGDVVLWDRSLLIVFEKIDHPGSKDLFVMETPEEDFSRVGGLDSQIRQILDMIETHTQSREMLREYGMTPLRGILFYGPPGTGKTLCARATANYLGRLSPTGQSRFINVKPSEWLSSWYSKSEENIRNFFAWVNEVAMSDSTMPVVIFMDEIDSIGRARGDCMTSHVDDRVLTTLLAELDGVEKKAENLVIMAATNRYRDCDPALLRPGRMADLTIELPRPNQRASSSILSKHLRPQISYDGNDRDGVIEATAAYIHSPNGLSDLATVKLRDGNVISVGPKDLISGAILQNVAKRACLEDVKRRQRGERAGVRLQDLLDAATSEMVSASKALSRHNVRDYVPSIPQDVDVVSVNLVPGRSRNHRFMNMGSAA